MHKDLCFDDTCKVCNGFIADLEAGRMKPVSCELCDSTDRVPIYTDERVSHAVCDSCYSKYIKPITALA